jgi:hypothetical protein
MGNRDITKDEINRITEKCPPREKAFFTIMRQSGLPPHTIKQLKIENLEGILNSNTPIPCKIDVPHDKSRTFIGEEAVKYLKQYLATRTNLAAKSLLFTIQNNPKKEINTKDVSRAFRLSAQKLEKERKINYEIRRGKPSELRLYSLIKFYRKNAKYYLTELSTSSITKDYEFYRKLYEEKAMPFLEIEPPTPMDIRKLRQQQQQEIERRDKQIQGLKNSINEIHKKLEEPESEEPEFEEESPEYLKELDKLAEEDEKRMKEHPEQKEQPNEFDKWVKEHPEEAKQIEEQDEEMYREHLEAELDKIRNQIKEIQDIVKKTK